MNNKTNKLKLDDYIIYCSICARPCKYSESTTLDTYTGRGKIIVCPYDVDSIDYGLVPYSVQEREFVRTTRINHHATNPNDVPTELAPIDIEIYDPMNYDPNNAGTTHWKDITALWEQSPIIWGQ
jgi:hypothetical protein